RPPPAARRTRCAVPPARPAAASRARESETRPNGRGDAPHRSPGSGTGGWRASQTQLSGSVRPGRLRGEASPALAAAALEDRPAGLRRHPRTEAVLALAAADVWPVGALHRGEKARLCQKNPRGRRGAAVSIDKRRPPPCPQPQTTQRCGRSELPPRL